MKNKSKRVVNIAKVVIALPLILCLALLAIEFVKMYGFIVIPLGLVMYLLITLFVDKFFGKQSAQLEQVLERKLTSGRAKSGDVLNGRQDI